MEKKKNYFVIYGLKETNKKDTNKEKNTGRDILNRLVRVTSLKWWPFTWDPKIVWGETGMHSREEYSKQRKGGSCPEAGQRAECGRCWETSVRKEEGLKESPGAWWEPLKAPEGCGMHFTKRSVGSHHRGLSRGGVLSKVLLRSFFQVKNDPQWAQRVCRETSQEAGSVSGRMEWCLTQDMGRADGENEGNRNRISSVSDKILWWQIKVEWGKKKMRINWIFWLEE